MYCSVPHLYRTVLLVVCLEKHSFILQLPNFRIKVYSIINYATITNFDGGGFAIAIAVPAAAAIIAIHSW